MDINKLIVENNEIKQIEYRSFLQDDAQLLDLKSRISAVWNNVFINRAGYELYIHSAYVDVSDSNIITINSHLLNLNDSNELESILDSVPDSVDSALSRNRNYREFNNKTQIIEIEYTDPTTVTPFTVPENITLRRITQEFDTDYTDQNKKNVYVVGSLSDVNTLVQSLNSELSATMPDGYVLSVNDSFKLVFNGASLIECSLSPHDAFPDVDKNLSEAIYHNLLLDKQKIYWTFDLTNNTKSFEIAYTQGSAYPVEPLGKNLLLLMITEEYDENSVNKNIQNVYVQGRLSDVYTWAKSIKSDIALPIPDNLNEPDKIIFEDDGVLAIEEGEFMANDDMDYILFEDSSKMIIREHELIEDEDYFKFTFDSNDELTSVTLYGHVQRQEVRSAKIRREFYDELSVRYSDAITNLSVTETLMPECSERIVQPKYDTDGYRYADD